MQQILDILMEAAESDYADFTAKLAPTLERGDVIGVRVPIIRKKASEIVKIDGWESFLDELPHRFHEENMLHAILISKYIKDYDRCIKLLDMFLPYVDNWAVCDALRPVIFTKEKYDKVTLDNIIRWVKSEHDFTKRFGVEMLMTYYLDDRFKPEYLEIPAQIISEEYYVNMMLAWYYATALAKQYEDTICYLTGNRLPVWVHNKTIQKARESYRISDDTKEMLKSLKRSELM